jgi:hypothetical protein
MNRLLRRTVQVRLGTNTPRLPSGKPILMVSRQQFMKHLDYRGLGIRFFEVKSGEKSVMTPITKALNLRNNLAYKLLHFKLK